MKISEFKIGQDFDCGGNQWRCTDIGSRVVVAISLQAQEITTVDAANQKASSITTDSSWLNGPPYAVVEQVFDEHDLPACTPIRRMG